MWPSFVSRGHLRPSCLGPSSPWPATGLLSGAAQIRAEEGELCIVSSGGFAGSGRSPAQSDQKWDLAGRPLAVVPEGSWL